MQVIESRSNARLKRIRRILSGREEKYFILEGKKLLEEALHSGILLVEVYADEEFGKREKELLARCGADLRLVSSSILRSISEVETPQGVVGVAEKPAYGNLPLPIGYAGLLYGIQDPGNLGTIVRAAEAAGCEFLVLSGDCADPYQPKAVRASMGSIFRLPVFNVKDPNELVSQWKKKGVHFYGLFPKADRVLFETKPEYPAILMIGSESRGLPKNLTVDTKLWIPMKGQVESINAAMAAVIGFYYFLRKP